MGEYKGLCGMVFLLAVVLIVSTLEELNVFNMKFLSVRELRGNASAVWKELPDEKEMVVTNHGKPIAILSTVGDADMEDCLKAIRRARATTAVAKLQMHSLRQGLDQLTDEEIEAEIAAVRRERKE